VAGHWLISVTVIDDRRAGRVLKAKAKALHAGIA
jgi:hypothetical protein